MLKSPSSSSHNLISYRAKVEMFTYSLSEIYRVSQLKFLEWSACPLTFWKNLDIFSPLESDIQKYSVHETPNIKLYSVRTLKRHLNEKHGQETATISKFSGLGFEMYFNTIWMLHCSLIMAL